MAAGDLTATRATVSDKDGAVFDGIDDFIDTPHNANQLGANLLNGFTISVWINPYSLGPDTGRVIDKTSDSFSANGFYYKIQTNGRIAFRIDGGTEITSGNSSVPFFEWTHCLVTISSVQIATHYINGILSGTPADLGKAISEIVTTNAPRIGNRATNTDKPFDGAISKVKMWNRVLTATEILQDCDDVNIPTGLILDIPLETDYNDKSNTGLIGTNSGSFLIAEDFNRIIADVESLNLTAATDNLEISPIAGRDNRYTVSKIEREA